MISKMVGTRAETLVDEQNHNCSPILSIAFVFSMLSDVLMSLGLVSCGSSVYNDEILIIPPRLLWTKLTHVPY